MKTGTPPVSVAEYRIRARRLLNQLRSESTDAAAAAARFRELRSFASQTVDQLLAGREQVRLKHALAVIAQENGQPSWRALKTWAESAAAPEPMPQATPGREMYDRGLDVLLNRWFARYEDARASLAEHGGYLLPFDRQFFICEREGIRVLGLDPDDPDWQRIGWDWVEPHDAEAWNRLRRKRRRVLAQAL